MLGATLTSALAQTWDLADFADSGAPFLAEGVLDNTVFVVGKAAQTADVLGAIDMAAALQAKAVTQEEVEIEGTIAPTATQGAKVEKSGTKFLYNRDIYDVHPETFDENDLPDVLEEETFDDNKGDNKEETDYDQELQFEDGVGTLLLTQPEDMDSGSYLTLDKNDRVYNYTLDFDSAVEYDTSAVSTEFVGNTIELQGRKYTITQASGTSGVLTKLTLVGGDSTVWLVQDQPYTVGDHTVTVVDVGNSGTVCGINVDGQTKWIEEGDTEEVGDLSVGVLDVIEVNTQAGDADTCEISLGSNELVLENDDQVRVNDVDLEGSSISFSGSAGSWDGFTIRYRSGKEDDGVNSDDINLEAGGAWTDPVFGNFKLEFAGVTADYEDLMMDVSGDDAEFTFTNNDGKEVVIPFHAESNGAIYPGSDDDAPLLRPGDATGVGWVPAVTDSEGVLLYYVTTGGEVHVLEISDVTCDSSNNKTTIRDITYDSNVAKDEELTADCSSAAIETVSLGSLGSIQLNLTSSSVGYVAASGFGDADGETEFEGNVSFTNETIGFTEKAGDEATPATVEWSLSWDTSDDEINIGAPSGTSMGPVDNSETDDDTVWYATTKGTLVKYDQEDDLSLELMAPEEDAFASVFVMPLSGTVVSGSGGGTIMTDSVNPFSVGLAVLDEDLML
jgi:hypothetical protein